MNSRYLQTLGIPGLLGVGLLLFCASYYFSTIAPMQTQLVSLRNEAQRLATTHRVSTPSSIPVAIAESNASTSGIKPVSDPIEIIRRLNATAEASAVTVDRASYTISEQDGLRRIEVSLPAKGAYLAIRGYLHEAMAIGGNAQLDSLVLQRSRATDTVLDANLKLSFELDPQ